MNLLETERYINFNIIIIIYYYYYSHEEVVLVSYVPKRHAYKKLNTRDVLAIQINIVTADGRSVNFAENAKKNYNIGIDVNLHFRPVVFNESE